MLDNREMLSIKFEPQAEVRSHSMVMQSCLVYKMLMEQGRAANQVKRSTTGVNRVVCLSEPRHQGS